MAIMVIIALENNIYIRIETNHYIPGHVFVICWPMNAQKGKIAQTNAILSDVFQGTNYHKVSAFDIYN